MSTEYGRIFDASQIKSQLSEANRDYMGRKTWESLYGSINLNEQNQLGQLQTNYAQAVSKAYAQAQASNASIAASNLGQGYKAAAMSDVDAALQQAYDSYRNSYLEGAAEVQNTAAQAIQKVSAAQTTQAENYKKLADKPYDYLKYLFDKYSEGAAEDNPFLNDDPLNVLWRRYTYKYYDPDDPGYEINKKLGMNYETRLRDWSDIQSEMFDEQGNLTKFGTDFYKQMFNQNAYEGNTELSFGRWLADTDEDLYNWSQSYNPYDFTGAGTNLGSFKTFVGMGSTEETYKFIDAFSGMSEEQVNDMFSNITKKAEEIGKNISDKYKETDSRYGKDSKKIAAQYAGLIDDVRDIFDRMGVTEDFEKETGIKFSELSDVMQEYVNTADKNKETLWTVLDSRWGNTFADIAGKTEEEKKELGMNEFGNTLFAPVQLAYIGLGTLLSGWGNAVRDSKNKRRTSVQQERLSQDTYNKFIAAVIEYARSKGKA